MKKRGNYKHTEAYLKKKAKKDQDRQEKLAKRKQQKALELAAAKGLITHWQIMVAFFKELYGISELELLFGSNDIFIQKRIEVARKYVMNAYERGSAPNFKEIVDYFVDYAIDEYCRELDIDPSIFYTLCSHKQKEIFINSALKYTYDMKEIDDNLKERIKSTKDDLCKYARESYSEIENKKKDLRRGTVEERNSRRFSCIKVLLENFEAIEKGEKRLDLWQGNSL